MLLNYIPGPIANADNTSKMLIMRNKDITEHCLVCVMSEVNPCFLSDLVIIIIMSVHLSVWNLKQLYKHL